MNYTDGNGKYFAPGSLLTGDSTNQIVNIRTVDLYTSQTMSVNDIQLLVKSGWIVAPNLTDIGGGVWVNGSLVDPS